LLAGNLKNAAGSLDEARKLDSQSLFASATLASLRAREGQFAEAASLLEIRYRAVPSLANLYDYAAALDRAGKPEQAAVLFQEFETKAAAARNNPYNANGRLIFYYADRKREPEKALDIARQEIAIRRDCPTLDAYAWALFRVGQLQEAKAQIDRALAVGVRDAASFCHAARIAAATGDEKGAHLFEAKLQELNPDACPADVSLPQAVSRKQ
jgi:Tfp pilus assembly protein PilF